MYLYIDINIDRQTGYRQTDVWIDSQVATDRHLDRQTGSWTDRRMDRQVAGRTDG